MEEENKKPWTGKERTGDQFHISKKTDKWPPYLQPFIPERAVDWWYLFVILFGIVNFFNYRVLNTLRLGSYAWVIALIIGWIITRGRRPKKGIYFLFWVLIGFYVVLFFLAFSVFE